MELSDLLAGYLVLTKILLFAVAVLITVSSLDDLVIDVWYWSRRIYRALFVYRRHPRLTIEALRANPEQPIAIMVPAWQESEVIRHMLDNAIGSLEYRNYVIFVGCYPNDVDTQREVEIARERHPRVQRVVTPHDGPTCKADCLNWVVQAITAYEEDNGLRFAALVMHDAEDVVHPLELKLFNHLIPRFDFVQLPVYPLEMPWYHLTAGHYMDEFAENHGKDLVVREAMISQVPCAGVAAAFSRRAIDEVAARSNNLVFDTGSVTEDYEFTFRLYRLGITRQIFVRFGIERPVMRRPLPFMKPREVRRLEFVAVREFFPTSFRAAVRQKGRWIVGIVFQGWQNLGWRGTPAVRYVLMRDRKTLLTSATILLSYVIAANIIVMWLVETLFPWIIRFPALVEANSLLAWLLVLNGGFLTNRLLQRMFFCWEVYGTGTALMTFPRQVWGNVVNFFSVMRALRLFIQYLRTGRIIAWDKTAHVFPSVQQLRSYHRRIGDLLLERRLVTMGQLEEALARQRESGQLLGDLLLDSGAVPEDELYETLARQLDLPLRHLDPRRVPPEALALLPLHLARTHSVFAAGITPEGELELACCRSLGRDERDTLTRALGRPLRFVLVPRSDIAFALRRARDGDLGEAGRPPLGQRLLRDGLLSEAQLDRALRLQRRAYLPLGQILLRRGLLTRPRLEEAVARCTAGPDCWLGEFLVEQGAITRTQLDEALAEQLTRTRKIGEILLEEEAIERETLESYLAPRRRAWA